MEIGIIVALLAALAWLAQSSIGSKNKEIKQLEANLQEHVNYEKLVVALLNVKLKENHELQKELLANLTDDELAIALSMLPDD